MSYRTTRPAEARALLEGENWSYLDVRTVEEYEAGHVPGAFNIPLLHATPAGMQPNPDFLAVVEHAFSKNARLVVGCKVGGRSARACDLLASAGFTSLANMDGGFSGRYDMAGRLVEQGWSGYGYPVSSSAEAGRTYRELTAGV